MKLATRLWLAAAALLVLSLAGLGLWLQSGSALHWALSQAQSRTGGHLTVGTTAGTLRGPIELRDVNWTQGALRLHADSVRLEWRPLAAVGGRVQVRSAVLQGVRVTVRPSGTGGPLRFPLHPPSMPHLPVGIVLEQVQATDVDFSPGASLPTLHIDHAKFAARVDNRSIAVRELDLGGPDVAVQGSAELAINNDYALDASLDWRYRLPGWARFVGHTELKGDARALSVRQTLAAPYGLGVSGELRDAFTAPRWHGTLQLRRFELAVAHSGWPTYGGDANVSFRGDPAGTAFQGRGTFRGLPLGPLALQYSAAVKRQALDVDSLNVDLPDGGALEAKGSLAFDGRLSLTGGWKNLAWPLQAPDVHSPAGQFTLSSEPHSWRGSVNGTLTPAATVHADFNVARSAPHSWSLQADAENLRPENPLPHAWMSRLLPEGRWRLLAHGDQDRATVDKVGGDWLGGRLTARASYARAGHAWQAHAEIRRAHTERLDARLPGQLNAVVDAAGQQDKPGGVSRTEVRLQSLTGTLRGSAASAHGNVVLAGTSPQQALVDARLGDDSLHLDGDFISGRTLHWQLDAPSLAQAWPDAEGALHSRGSLQTVAGHALRTDLSLDLKQFAWRRYQAESLGFSTQALAGTGRATLKGVNLAMPGVNIGLVEARAVGTLPHHSVDLALDTDRGALRLAGSGGYADSRWRASLNRVDVTPAGAAEWHAAAPWALAVAPHLFDLPRACLLQDAARACVSLGIGPQGWHAQGSLQRMPLAALQPVLPKGLEYRGALNASLQAAGDSNSHHLSMDATLTPGGVRDLRGGRPLTLLAYSGGEAHMRSDAALTTGNVSWTLTDGGHLQVDTRITGGSNAALSGHIRGEFHDFALLPALVPEVSKASGRLALNITLAGSPLDPRFSGTTSFSDGAVSIPRLGVDVSGLQFTLAGDGTHLDLAGSLHSGRGDLSFKADGGREKGVWHATGNLEGTNFRAIDTTEAQVDLSPDLKLALDDHDLHVDGSINVPHAVLKPKNLAGTVQVSPDQVIVGEEGGPPEERWHLYSKIRLVLGTGVYFDGFGLNGDIGGRIVANTEPGHPTTGSGELNIQNGSYTATFSNLGSLGSLYKQKLDIEYGRLMFTGGPITDPALDIRAVRAEIPGVTQFGVVHQKVGVLVRGLLQAPDVALWSDPPLPQTQIVSALITGNPNLLEGSGGSTLANSTPGVVTASSLSGISAQSNQDMTLHVGGGQAAFDVGYSQLQVSGGAVTQGLFVGKQLSPRFYVRYAQATNEPYNILQFIYKLSSQWMLQAQSGSASSADIIYTLEH